MTALLLTVAAAAIANAVRLACLRRAIAIRNTGRYVMRAVKRPAPILVSF